MRSAEETDYAAKVERTVLTRGQRLTRTGIPKRYWDTSTGDLSWPAPLQPMADAMDDFVAAMKDITDQSWRRLKPPLLLGLPGIGKTTLACAAGVELSDAGFMVRYVKWASYINDLVQRPSLWRMYEATQDQGVMDELQQIRLRENDVLTCEVLIGDDIGREHSGATGFAGNTLDRTLRERYDQGVLSIVTSNVALNHWAEEYSPAMRSFLLDVSSPVDLDLSSCRIDELDFRQRGAA